MYVFLKIRVDFGFRMETHRCEHKKMTNKILFHKIFTKELFKYNLLKVFRNTSLRFIAALACRPSSPHRPGAVSAQGQGGRGVRTSGGSAQSRSTRVSLCTGMSALSYFLPSPVFLRYENVKNIRGKFRAS